MNLSPPRRHIAPTQEKNTSTHTPRPPPAHRRTPPAHARGVPPLRTPNPCQHHIPETSHIPSTPNVDTLSGPSTPTSTRTHAPPASGRASTKGTGARRARGTTHPCQLESTDHTHIHHKNSNGAPCPTAPHTTTEHVLDESTRNPRGTSTQHHQSPLRRHRHKNGTPRTPPVPCTTSACRNGPTITPRGSRNPYPSATPPPHRRLSLPRTHDRTTIARARHPPFGALQEQVGYGSCSCPYPTCSTPSRKEPWTHRSHHIHRGDTPSHHPTQGHPTGRQPHPLHRHPTDFERENTSTQVDTLAPQPGLTPSHPNQPHLKNTSAHHPTTPAHHVKPLTTVEKYTRIW